MQRSTGESDPTREGRVTTAIEGDRGYLAHVSWLGSSWCIVGAYILVSILTLILGSVEVARRRGGSEGHLWPAFWFGTTILLLAMAVGRAGDLGGLLADFGRRQARSEGWYQTRRSLQAVVVGSIAAVWAVAVIIAIWRVPERRRRYLPPALLVFTLVCFAGIRIISLHQIDAVLLRRDLAGAPIGIIIEHIVLLAIFTASLTMLVSSVRRRRRKPAAADATDRRSSAPQSPVPSSEPG